MDSRSVQQTAVDEEDGNDDGSNGDVGLTTGAGGADLVRQDHGYRPLDSHYH